MSFKKVINNPGFVVFYLFLITGLVLLSQYEEGDIVIWLNQQHNGFLDVFFKYFTFLGNGIIFVIIIIAFLLLSYFRAILFTIAVISQTVIIQVLKRIFFDDMVRPKLLLENFNNLHHVPGVEINSFGSFPSGHTATAFTVAVLLSIMSGNRYITVLLMILAIGVGISRIYLLQHFFIDVYFGALIGFLNGMVVWIWMKGSVLSNKPELKTGLIRK